MRKIGIIGLGHVGSHVAYSILHNGLANHLVLMDKDEKKAIAHSYDLYDGITYYKGNPKISYNDYSLLDDADIVVISVAGAIVAHERLKELKSSIDCVDDVLSKLTKTKFHGIILSITNPCDIVACYISKKTNYNVIGSGTVLDSSRLRMALAKELQINPVNINAYMLGEHGDSEFACYSNATISGINLLEYNRNIDLIKIEESVRFRATPIFNGKGCTEFAIGICACKIIEAILIDTNEILSVSYYAREYGYDDIYLSSPCIVGINGVKKIVKLKLNDVERSNLNKSYKIIKENLSKIL